MSKASRILRKLWTCPKPTYHFQGLERDLKSVINQIVQTTKPRQMNKLCLIDNAIFIGNISEPISDIKPPSFINVDNALYFFVKSNGNVCYIGWHVDLNHVIWKKQLGDAAFNNGRYYYPNNIFIGKEEYIASLGSNCGLNKTHIPCIKDTIDEVTYGKIRIFALELQPSLYLDTVGNLCLVIHYLKCGHYPILNYV